MSHYVPLIVFDDLYVTSFIYSWSVHIQTRQH